MKNPELLIGGILSCVAALLHVAIIFGGGSWYRFFGAGERLASMSDAGSPVPGIITFGIAAVLLIWGLYGFAGAGWMSPLPFMKAALIAISAIYLLRGLAFIPVFFFAREQSDAFLLWSSLICLGYGTAYGLGTWRYFHQAG
ncbi:MAG TPA: hypothetical protein VEC06_05210 [Paucimonas sp.]|nr:hypothetical protein [Paucimonas sp.]